MATTPPRTHQLAAGSITTLDAWVDIYTCPTNKVVIVKRLTWHTADGSDIDGQLGVRLGGVDGYVLYRGTVHTADCPSIEVDHVLEEGDVLQIYLNTGGVSHPIGYYVSGSILSNP